jgi:septal ring factor EnvC (AmiA/AmiB activator)
MVNKVLLCALVGTATASDESHKVNPIRRVVTMLQMMQNKVAAEGEKKEKIYNQFMCYCDNADATLGAAIDGADKKIPLLESGIKEDSALKAQLEADLKQHQSDRVSAKDAIAKATAIREKEKAAFSKASSDLKTNIGAMDKAIPAIEKGMGGFLQTSTASVLRQLSISLDMSSVDREMLTGFLSGKNGYSPASGEIVGILKTMHDEMSADLKQITDDENAAIGAFGSLVAAKEKEINALSRAIESKMTRVGDLGVKIAQMKNDLEDTIEDKGESEKFLRDLAGNCEKKKKEWAGYKEMQGQEMLALADTIKVLNDDDALELFKKTLPGSASSLMQVKSSNIAIRKKVIKHLQKLNLNDPRVDFLAIALRGGKVGFEKIIQMIDKLTHELKVEQAEDDAKKDYCNTELDKAEDNKKVQQQEKSDLETSIEDAQETIANLKTEIEALDDGIRALDKEVAEATETRQKEHEDFVEFTAANSAAVDLLKFAKNRLNKFYNPSQYKAPPKRELTEEQQITLNNGGTLAPTEAPGGIAGTGISAVQAGAAPPPPPEANLAYQKKGEESSGVIRLIDLLINDVEKDIQVADLEEKDAQKDYVRFMDNAAKKRAEDSKSQTDKEGALADTEEQLVNDKQGLKDKKMDLMKTEQLIGALHSDCDFLLKYYDVRKEARNGEIDAMGKARDVLNGADYSL